MFSLFSSGIVTRCPTSRDSRIFLPARLRTDELMRAFFIHHTVLVQQSLEYFIFIGFAVCPVLCYRLGLIEVSDIAAKRDERALVISRLASLAGARARYTTRPYVFIRFRWTSSGINFQNKLTGCGDPTWRLLQNPSCFPRNAFNMCLMDERVSSIHNFRSFHRGSIFIEFPRPLTLNLLFSSIVAAHYRTNPQLLLTISNWPTVKPYWNVYGTVRMTLSVLFQSIKQQKKKK